MRLLVLVLALVPMISQARSISCRNLEYNAPPGLVGDIDEKTLELTAHNWRQTTDRNETPHDYKIPAWSPEKDERPTVGGCDAPSTPFSQTQNYTFRRVGVWADSILQIPKDMLANPKASGAQITQYSCIYDPERASEGTVYCDLGEAKAE